MPSIRHQRGAILIMTAVLIVVLIGVAALAMDIGRLVVLRSQIQNAADAAAIAAAVELDGQDGARDRAMAAAREAVKHDKSFAKLQDLLGIDSLPNSAFAFYCMIGAEFDLAQDVAISGGFCQGVAEGALHVTAGGDADAHYVRVNLDPALAADRFTLDLIFLPILNLITPGTATEAAVRAEAVAGRQVIQCHYPPMAICDPYEGVAGKSFKEDMPIGATVTMRDQGGANWSPGNMGFLEPISGASGANAVADSLANPDDEDCATRRITTETGQMTQKTTSAINTRFDMYDSHFKESPPPGNWNNWPPAPNIYEYLDVDVPVAIAGLDGTRFSQPDWKYADAYPDGWRAAQVAAFGALDGTEPQPVGGQPPLRWDVYNWEISHSPQRILAEPISAHKLPLCVAPAKPSDTTPPSCVTPERRTLIVAIIRCDVLGINGKTAVLVNSPDGFAEFFVYKKATEPSGAKISGEYIRWLEPGDRNTHVDVQLYE